MIKFLRIIHTTEKWSLKVISLALHFSSKYTWWLTHSGASRTWSLWEEKMIATCRSALPISSSGCTALQIVVSTFLIFFFHCIWSLSLTWGDHWSYSEEKRIMTSRKMRLLIKLLHIAEKNWSSKTTFATLYVCSECTWCQIQAGGAIYCTWSFTLLDHWEIEKMIPARQN